MKDKLIIFVLSTILTGLLNAQTKSSYLEGMAYMQKADFTSAIDAFNSTESLSSNQIGTMHLNRGIAFFQTADFTKAEKDFRTSIELGVVEGHFWMAKIHAENQNILLCTNSLKQYYSGHDIFNTELSTKDDIFRPLYQTNEWQDFITAREKSEVETIINEATYYLNKNQIQEGVTYLNKELIQNQIAEVYYMRAKLYYAAEKYALATIDCKKALETEPDQNRTKELLADSYIKTNEYSKGITYYSEILVSTPEQFSIYLKLSNALILNGAFDQAKEIISTYSYYFPEDLNAQYLSADINYQLGDYKNALLALNKLLDEHIPKAEWFHKRGQCYLQTGTFKYAAEDFSMCLDLDPGNANANFNLGTAQYNLGNTDKACYYWERALMFGDNRANEHLLENCQ